MSGSTRRRLLSGVSLGAVLFSTVWTEIPIDRGGAGDDRAATGGEGESSEGGGATTPLDVTIVETNAPVDAGAWLEVTAAVENTGPSDVRAEVDLIVGDDPERVGRIRTTIEAGETSDVTHGFYTYPTPTDSEFPVRMRADGAADERTVSVRAASELPMDRARPDRSLTVQPGTEVLFEVETVDSEASPTTLWWVDGEQVGGAIGGPWQAAYEAETGARYWREQFESTGTFEVAVAVPADDGTASDAAYWEVTVGDDGNAAPTVDTQRPTPGPLSVTAGETVTVELDASDTDGGLDRVVWWHTQADVILDVTELDGDADTATLSVDGDLLCHTCQLLPWVIGADGTITPAAAWEIVRADRST